jgi:hypothetical protein
MHCCKECFNVGFICLLLSICQSVCGDGIEDPLPDHGGGKNAIYSPSHHHGDHDKNAPLEQIDKLSFVKYLFEKYGDGVS